MKRLYEIFALELKALVRSKTLLLLTLAALGWTLAAPHVLKGDGTVDGAREMILHYSLGVVFFITLVSLLASATGSIARERAQRRLQLTLVRPVRLPLIALGKIYAHAAVGALVLAVAALGLALSQACTRPCRHVLAPILPSPREEARAMYEAYRNDPDTPDQVKKAPRATVLRILEQRALDHYQTVLTNDCAAWTFDLAAFPGDLPDLAVQLRFTNHFDRREDVRGTFRFGAFGGVVSNVTRQILTVPLAPLSAQAAPVRPTELVFANEGRSALMLRPRRDVNLLVTADAFAWNLLRAWAELVAILTLVVAFGVFLSAGLGRPVALFTALVLLALSEMSPSVIEQYPDEIGASLPDRIGLVLTRLSADLTHPVSALAPLENLSRDACIEPRELARAAALDMILAPLLFSLLAALALPRKQDGGGAGCA